jgi:Rrf2 family nitric oxide-sensitive transcriptional repressor
MQLTAHTDFALRLLIYLAIHPQDKPATVKDAAERYGISINHLAKVAQKLVQEGVVESQRGRGGGLKLALPPEEINIGQLVRKTENMELLECFASDCSCPILSVCSLYGVLRKAEKAFLDVLDQYSLADIVKNKLRLIDKLQIA